ncbi:hypothetical protein ACQI4L_18535 [Mycolicibacterium litorale]|uniref:hypothetical protein n=1 Tax=Mycolicibacterium litorale TaxID=758802 RepID=UPI003CF1C3E7
MAEDELERVLDDLHERAEEPETDLPEQADVLLNVSEDEAIKAVQKQFKDAGTECTEEEARTLVHAAREKAERKKAEKNSEKDPDENSDEKSDDESDKDSDS